MRDQARFYYEQCKATARTPEQQAEWRLCMSDLSLAQIETRGSGQRFTTKFSRIAAMRIAPFHRGDACREPASPRNEGLPHLRKRMALRCINASRTRPPLCSPAPRRRMIRHHAASHRRLSQQRRRRGKPRGSSSAVRTATSRNGSGNSRCSMGLSAGAGDRQGPVIADLAATEMALKRYTGAPRLDRARPASIQRFFMDRSPPRSNPSLCQASRSAPRRKYPRSPTVGGPTLTAAATGSQRPPPARSRDG